MLKHLQILLHPITMNGLFNIDVYTGVLSDFIGIFYVK
jgi:hypothetical protein